jgi:hypothetical protein
VIIAKIFKHLHRFQFDFCALVTYKEVLIDEAEMLKLRSLIKSSSQVRMLASTPVVSPIKKVERQIDMQQALLDAEKVAGCSTSLINLRWVTSQNILNFIMLLRNLTAENNKSTMLQTLA